MSALYPFACDAPPRDPFNNLRQNAYGFDGTLVLIDPLTDGY